MFRDTIGRSMWSRYEKNAAPRDAVMKVSEILVCILWPIGGHLQPERPAVVSWTDTRRRPDCYTCLCHSIAV